MQDIFPHHAGFGFLLQDNFDLSQSYPLALILSQSVTRWYSSQIFVVQTSGPRDYQYSSYHCQIYPYVATCIIFRTILNASRTGQFPGIERVYWQQNH